MSHRVLLVEDEANYRQVFGMMIAGLGIELLEAGDGVEALEVLDRQSIDLVITDINMPRMDGIELLRRIRASSGPPVVIITAYGSVESAVEAMRDGAIDYLSKPFDEQRLRLTLERALQVTRLMAENRRLRDEVESKYEFSHILGESASMMEALRTAGKAARSEAAVLIRGESGTGKELAARAIHYNSPRAEGPFVAVNCAALPDTLLEAELFGAEVGAYTGATRKRRGRIDLAAGGTLFLDEIGDMPLALQAKLLRLLQERTYIRLGGEKELHADVRFLFATNRDLEQMVAGGEFREDLFYRVSVLPVQLPPLRARGSDVILLAEAFVVRACERMGRRAMVLSAQARTSLGGYEFPGNVRELHNIVERAVILAEGDTLEAPDLALSNSPRAAVSDASPGPAVVGQRGVELPVDGVSLEDVERQLVRQALDRTAGNKTRAAKLLGLTRATLRYRIEKLNL